MGVGFRRSRWAAAALAGVFGLGCAAGPPVNPEPFSKEWREQRNVSPERKRAKDIVLMGDEEDKDVFVFEDREGKKRVGFNNSERISAGAGDGKVDLRYEVPLSRTPKRFRTNSPDDTAP